MVRTTPIADTPSKGMSLGVPFRVYHGPPGVQGKYLMAYMVWRGQTIYSGPHPQDDLA